MGHSGSSCSYGEELPQSVERGRGRAPLLSCEEAGSPEEVTARVQAGGVPAGQEGWCLRYILRLGPAGFADGLVSG